MIKVKVIFSVLVGLLILSCNEEIPQDDIPPATFPDIVINLDLPTYAPLQFDNGHVPRSEGVRGIIIYRVNASLYNAFEVNCSYLPYDACSSVRVDQSNLFLRDDCCGSFFDPRDGFPTAGPATQPLRRYTTNLQGRTLTITDDILF